MDEITPSVTVTTSPLFDRSCFDGLVAYFALLNDPVFHDSTLGFSPQVIAETYGPWYAGAALVAVSAETYDDFSYTPCTYWYLAVDGADGCIQAAARLHRQAAGCYRGRLAIHEVLAACRSLTLWSHGVVPVVDSPDEYTATRESGLRVERLDGLQPCLDLAAVVDPMDCTQRAG